MPWSDEACLQTMIDVNGFIVKGADTFLKKEYTYLTYFCIVFAVVLVCAVDMPWTENEAG